MTFQLSVLDACELTRDGFFHISIGRASMESDPGSWVEGTSAAGSVERDWWAEAL